MNFANLIDRLYFTYSNNEKLRHLIHFIATEPDPERGYALATLAGVISFTFFKPKLLIDAVTERIDPVLFAKCYDYVGDLSETIALLWDANPVENFPSLTEIIATLENLNKNQLKQYIIHLLDRADVNQRWVFIKLCTGVMRIGISQRFIKHALAKYGHKTIHDLEHVWHAVEPPYLDLFAWLEKKAKKPNPKNKLFFHPVMLSHPISEKELAKINPKDYVAEYKYDGIRVQLTSTELGVKLYTRTGDDIGATFPDIIHAVNFHAVLDGELVIYYENAVQSFSDLQQRLNRKKPSKELMQKLPAHIVVYDMLMHEEEDIRNLPFIKRRAILAAWYKKQKSPILSLSPLLKFKNYQALQPYRERQQKNIEGLMFKRKLSPYLAGRPKGEWFKWKRDPLTVDAVLMYAQRGQGKRSSFYSDYTFGLWKTKDVLLPIGKAYFGFTDEELYQLDKWIRAHTVNKFGPVREVSKTLVFEVAFDAVQRSNRHKSGIALRFPRINRIRWDKPAEEADHLDVLAEFLGEGLPRPNTAD